MPTYYIQRIEGQNKKTLETVDEFATKKEANNMRYEYVMADPYARYYISTRPCKAWREKEQKPLDTTNASY